MRRPVPKYRPDDPMSRWRIAPVALRFAAGLLIGSLIVAVVLLAA